MGHQRVALFSCDYDVTKGAAFLGQEFMLYFIIIN